VRIAAILAAALAWPLAAGAQDIVESGRRVSGPGADVDLLGTRDTDGFSARHVRLGYLWADESFYRFAGIHVGADDYRQGNWSRSGASLLGAYKDVERATGAGLTVVGGLQKAGSETRAVGEFTWNVRLSPATGVEFVGNRDFVETRPGIDGAVMSNFVAASADHSVTDRFTLIGLAGAQAFSDDNTRWHLRGKAIYLLSPEYGFGAELRLRAYESQHPGPAAYFNPEHYGRAELGLRLRRSFGDWRVTAEAGAGSEVVDQNPAKSTYYSGLRVQRTFSSFTLVAAYTAQRSSDSHAATSADGNYRWQYLHAFLLLPF
jgi:hypothetical protein